MKQKKRRMRVPTKLERLRETIAYDAYAMQFQTLAQYRAALLQRIDQLQSRRRTA